jgi:hypothetical protein
VDQTQNTAATVTFTNGGCLLDGAGSDQILGLQLPVSTADVVEVVDFGTRGGRIQDYDLKVRCGDAGCITFTIGGPGVASDTYEKATGNRSHSIGAPWSPDPNTLLHTSGGNRAIFAVRSSSMTVCLNGKCWSSGESTVDILKPGDVVFSVTGNDSHNPAEVEIYRLMVFQAASAGP